MELGYSIGISLGCALREYGDDSNVLVKAMKPQRADDVGHRMEGVEPASRGQKFDDALDLSVRTHSIVLRRFGDPNILPYFHTVLAFMYHMSAYTAAMAYLGQFPWKLASLMLI